MRRKDYASPSFSRGKLNQPQGNSENNLEGCVMSKIQAYKIEKQHVFIRLKNRICESPEELLNSALCNEIIKKCVADLTRKNSLLLKIFPSPAKVDQTGIRKLIKTMLRLAKNPNIYEDRDAADQKDPFLKDRQCFADFIDYLYNYWRNYSRFIVCDSTGEDFYKHPYRTFNETIEALTHLVRRTYRDIQENVLKVHPGIYRQVSAGAGIAVIVAPQKPALKGAMADKIGDIPMVRQILLYPPLVIDQLMNKRKGKFERIQKNPLDMFQFEKSEWLCFPAKVGSLLILVYFHEKFFELGLSLSNLFELADEDFLKKKPDAVYFYGIPSKAFRALENKTVFYEDAKNDLLIGAVPDDDEFGYFGYLKKMVLTLHNIRQMKENHMPFHGALVKIYLRDGKAATILMIGDSGAGKSETLEAFRSLAEKDIQDMIIIADDMGSLKIDSKGRAIGYGTEIGAFLRLDDLQPGYAFGQIDRAIIMSPNKINARIVLPVTTYANVIQGFKIDFVLYANNYEEIDDEHPIIEKFEDLEEAMRVFREGTVMSKGTTASTGLVHTYFANVFGPAQYKELHETVSKKYFEAFFKQDVYVGQMRTRLGIEGWERKGPEETAKALLELIRTKSRK